MAAFVGLRLGLRDAFDEIIGRHVRTDAGRFGAFTGPGEVAVVAIKFLGQYVDVREEADEEIRQGGFVGVLRVVHAEGVTFRAANRTGDSFFGGIPALQLRVGLFELIDRDVEARTMDAGAIVKFGTGSGIV